MRRGRMVLRHHQNAFSLSIAALDYVNGSNYSYFYNIEGLDGDWHDNYHSNTLAFAAFPTGRYALGVRYRNNTTGEWSPVSRLPIRVLAPPYASTWAWIGYLAATLGVVIGLSGYLIRRRRLRARLRQSLYEQRQRELVYESCIWSFSNLTNELSIPVTLINGPCQQIMGCKSADAFVRRQAELIRHNAQKINDLIYMLNEFQSTDPVDGSDDIEMLDVSRTAGGIAQTFADYAGENRIAYRTAVGSGVLFPSVRKSDDDLQYPAVPMRSAGRGRAVRGAFRSGPAPCRVRTGRLPAPGRRLPARRNGFGSRSRTGAWNSTPGRSS